MNGEIIVTLSSEEKRYPYDRLSVEYTSTDDEILDALAPVLLEEEGFNIRQEQREGYFTIKRVDASNNIYVFPKSTAGQAWGLQTYSDGLVRNTVQVTITAAENGYIVKLNGSVKPTARSDDWFNNSSSISKEFVYSTLAGGLSEVEKFFDALDKSKDVKNVELKVKLNGNTLKIIEVLPTDAKDIDKVSVHALQYLPDEIQMKQYTVAFEGDNVINFKVVL